MLMSALAALWLLADIQFLLVHGPKGQEIELVIKEISSIRQINEKHYGHFTAEVKCLIFMTNGQFVATRETCLEVVQMISAITSGHKEPH